MNIAIGVILSLLIYLVIVFLFRIVNTGTKFKKIVEPILGILAIIFIVVSLILMAFAPAQFKMLGFGIMFAFIGAMVMNTDTFETNSVDKIKSKLVGIIFAMVGLGAMEVSIIYCVEPDISAIILDTVIPIVILSIFSVFGVILTFLGIKNSEIPKEFSVKISARCTGSSKIVSKDNDGHTNTTYSPIYKYQYNGKEYTSSDNLYTYGCPKVDQIVTIYICSENPNLIWDYNRRCSLGKTLKIIGTLMSVCGIFALGLFLF